MFLTKKNSDFQAQNVKRPNNNPNWVFLRFLWKKGHFLGRFLFGKSEKRAFFHVFSCFFMILTKKTLKNRLISDFFKKTWKNVKNAYCPVLLKHKKSWNFMIFMIEIHHYNLQFNVFFHVFKSPNLPFKSVIFTFFFTFFHVFLLFHKKLFVKTKNTLAYRLKMPFINDKKRVF